MAFPTSVNNQITDAVAQANTKVLGDAPATALSNLYIATSQALANAAHNATTNQDMASITMQAATTQGISTLYSVDTATTGLATQTVYQQTVHGHIYTRLASPAGKQDLQRAVDQANSVSESKSDSKVMDTLMIAQTAAIQTALSEGVSKQSINHVLHEALEQLNISTLYPFDTRGETISANDIKAYYQAIIAADLAQYNDNEPEQ